MNNKHIKILILFAFIFLMICIIILYHKTYNETFKPEPIDKTRLYGTIFLDNLDTQIQNLTDPPIMYDIKTIEINRYNDLLL